MKKMKTVLGALVGVVLAVSFAYAEVPEKPLHVYLQGGATLPMDDLKDWYKTGFNAGAGIGYSINENFEIVGRLLYHSMKPDIPSGYDIDGGDLTTLMYGGELKFNTGDEERNFYLIGGLGLAKVKQKDIESGGQTTDGTDDSGKYFCLGAGIEFGKFFIEGRYVILKGDDDDDEASEELEEIDSGSDEMKIIPISIGFKF